MQTTNKARGTTAPLYRTALPRAVFSCGVALAVACAAAQPVAAQSSMRRPAGGQAAPQGGAPKAGQAPVAMNGYCPVCVVEMKQWIKGDPRFAVVHDGKTYLFPSEEQKQMFEQNPGKYTPALGGDCTVCKAEMGERAPAASISLPSSVAAYSSSRAPTRSRCSTARRGSTPRLIWPPMANAPSAASRCSRTSMARRSFRRSTKDCVTCFPVRSRSRCSWPILKNIA